MPNRSIGLYLSYDSRFEIVGLMVMNEADMNCLQDSIGESKIYVLGARRSCQSARAREEISRSHFCNGFHGSLAYARIALRART